MKYCVILETKKEFDKFYDMNFRHCGGSKKSFRMVPQSGDFKTVYAFVSQKGTCIEVFYELPSTLEEPVRAFDFDEYAELQAGGADKISAEEAVEVLFKEYNTGAYKDIFGEDFSFLNLENKLTSAGIVSKIAAWKDKQAAKVKVNEDMIADALDEKFGVGNWTREENFK